MKPCVGFARAVEDHCNERKHTMDDRIWILVSIPIIVIAIYGAWSAFAGEELSIKKLGWSGIVGLVGLVFFLAGVT